MGFQTAACATELFPAWATIFTKIYLLPRFYLLPPLKFCCSEFNSNRTIYSDNHCPKWLALHNSADERVGLWMLKKLFFRFNLLCIFIFFLIWFFHFALMVTSVRDHTPMLRTFAHQRGWKKCTCQIDNLGHRSRIPFFIEESYHVLEIFSFLFLTIPINFQICGVMMSSGTWGRISFWVHPVNQTH